MLNSPDTIPVELPSNAVHVIDQDATASTTYINLPSTIPTGLVSPKNTALTSPVVTQPVGKNLKPYVIILSTVVAFLIADKILTKK